MRELGLNFYIWASWPKIENPHKFSSLKLLILDETILEITYCKSNFGKNKLEFLPFWGVFELISIFWVHWTKIKGHKLRHYGLLGVLNTLLALFHTGETDSGKKPCFLNISFFVKFAYIWPKMQQSSQESPCCLQYLLFPCIFKICPGLILWERPFWGGLYTVGLIFGVRGRVIHGRKIALRLKVGVFS